MRSLIVEEVSRSSLPDVRLEDRLIILVDALAGQPEASIPLAAGSWPATRAAYRFFDNDRVAPEAIRSGCTLASVERARDLGRVLIVQDTTTLNFTHHPCTKGLGYLENDKLMGLVLHTSLVCSVEGVPLGIVTQDCWARDPEQYGKRDQRRERPFDQKESAKWVNALNEGASLLKDLEETITIADSEADVFETFASERPANAQLLIRAAQNRRVEGQEAYLWNTVMAGPVRGRLSVAVRAKDGESARTADCSVRFQSVTVYPPRHASPGSSHREKVTLQAVLIWEENPPGEVEPLCWLLLTTLNVESLSDALCCVELYRRRWLVERYHFVLKSGCRVEKLQLETAERIERAVAVYSLVALKLLWMTYQARQTPEAPCSCVLEEYEWQALYCTIHKTDKPPDEPPTLKDAVRWIAQLGGFMGRKGDGEPGVMVLWRGMRRLDDIASTWLLLCPPRNVGNG